VTKWMAMALVAASLLLSGCATTTTSGEAQRAAEGSTISRTNSSGSPSGGANEGPGSLSHAGDEQFCASHECIANFPNGHGEVVQCSDSEWSHSGGITGACTDHGGVKGEASEATTETKATEPPAAGGTGTEGAGSLSHAEDAQFCGTHECIENFADGHGEVVQCTDGEWSHSGGLSGACSDHGGERAGGSEATDSGEASAASASVKPLEALNHYWADVRDHGFSEAYNYLAPSARSLSESQFVASERKSGIEDAQFDGSVTSSEGDTAYVAVVSLVTHDAEFGCRSWGGSYTMVEEDGNWRIARASISPRSCSE
jgi:hypothetical protein